MVTGADKRGVMGRLASFFGIISKVESPDLTVIQDRCVAVRNKNAQCGRCAQNCTGGCITLVDNELVVAPEKCVSCGTCSAVCPTEAIRMTRPTDDGLVDAAIRASEAADGMAIFACQQILDAASGLFDPTKVAAVKCLGRVDEYMMIKCIAEGYSRVVLVHSDCSRCDRRAGFPAVERARANALAIMDTWHIPGTITLADKLPSRSKAVASEAYDSSRRGFFSEVRDSLKGVAVATAVTMVDGEIDMDEQPASPTKVDDRGVLPQHYPARRGVLLGILDAAGAPEEGAVIDSRMWATLSIDTDACTSCRMCATFCPTGAIFKFHTKKGAIGVKHRPRQCVACGTCADICPKKAITLSYEVPADLIASGEVTRFAMKPEEREATGIQSILHAMQGLLDMTQVYER